MSGGVWCTTVTGPCSRAQHAACSAENKLSILEVRFKGDCVRADKPTDWFWTLPTGARYSGLQQKYRPACHGGPHIPGMLDVLHCPRQIVQGHVRIA